MVTSAPDSTVLICTAAPIASGAVGTVTNISMTDDPGVTAVVRFLVPSGQTWIFEDLYISTTAGSGATVDPVVRIFKDGGEVTILVIHLILHIDFHHYHYCLLLFQKIIQKYFLN